MDEWRHNIESELTQVRQQIEAHKRKLIELRNRRKVLERKIYEPSTGELRGSDTLFVLSSEIRPQVIQWIELYNTQNGGKGGSSLLSDRSGVSTRLIRKVKNGSGGNLITLQTADRLLTAMDMGYRIHDLTILEHKLKKVIPPDAPYSKYEEE